MKIFGVRNDEVRKEGDILTEEFIKTLSEEDQQAADQINRRTEFSVLSLTYNMK